MDLLMKRMILEAGSHKIHHAIKCIISRGFITGFGSGANGFQWWAKLLNLTSSVLKLFFRTNFSGSQTFKKIHAHTQLDGIITSILA